MTTAAATPMPSAGMSDGSGEGRTTPRGTGAATSGIPRSADVADPAPEPGPATSGVPRSADVADPAPEPGGVDDWSRQDTTLAPPT